jgi:UDP-glucose 4-epimerase
VEDHALNNKRIVITGGGGFIAVTLAEMLSEDNEIILYDLNFENNAYSFSNLKNKRNVTPMIGDIMNVDELDKVVQGADIIIHMAARIGVQKVIKDALNTLEINYIGASNILRSSLESSNCERVIMFSTSEIFGVNAFDVAENGNSTFAPVEDIRWCYAISKLASEHLALSYYRQKGLPTVIVRPFNVFGPKRIGDHVVIRFVVKALKGEDLEAYGDGTQIRSWCYVDDFCDALIRCIEKPAAVGQSFNIGNARNTVTIYDLARKIIALSGSKSKINFKPVDFRDIELRVPNTNKARDVLGFIPATDLDDGLLRTIEWAKANNIAHS